MPKFGDWVMTCLSMLCNANAVKNDPHSSSSHLMLGTMSGIRHGPLVTSTPPNPLHPGAEPTAQFTPSSPLLLVPHCPPSLCPAWSSKANCRVQPTGSLLEPDEFH